MQPDTTPPQPQNPQPASSVEVPSDLPSNPMEEPPEENSHDGLKSVFGTILLILAAPLIAVVFTMFIFQSYEVDGPSMQNTLQNQDRLIIYKLPRTFARITKKTYIPKRYDVVVFDGKNLLNNDEFSSEGDKQLIKRVIGLPGERVVVKDNKITVYNKEHPEGFNPDEFVPPTADNKTTPGEIDVVVGENEIFVMGDNRNNSLDSRYFGPVPGSEVVGKLILRLWPDTQTF
jgi:signal peptidase I